MAKKRNSGEGKMFDPKLLEEHYKRISSNLEEYLPEGMIELNIEMLHRLNILDYNNKHEELLTRFFHVIESPEKITLVNDDFIVWIVPDHQAQPKTVVLVALNQRGVPKLELGFVTKDVYNSSKLILIALEKFLHDIQENEESLRPYTLD